LSKAFAATGGPVQKVIYVVGPTKLQNSLMAAYLENTLSLPCVAVQCVADIPPIEESSVDIRRLILFDCMVPPLGCAAIMA